MLNKLLQILGHNPTTTAPTRMTYKSPWNTNERTASCNVYLSNKWDGIDPFKEFKFTDYSSGNDGDIYDFVGKYFNISFSQSKQKINELLGVNYQEHNRPIENNRATALDEKQKTAPSLSFTGNKKENEMKIKKIKKVQPLQNKALIGYLNERGISKKIAEKYLSEIYYETDKNYFAISFLNDSGGREVRNKYFKGGFGKKDISLITPNPRDKRVKIFEGFMDFLSYLEINITAPLSNYLIINSTNLQKKGLIAIQGKFEAYELYLDNDRAGNESTRFFMNKLSNAVDKRVHYRNYKDLNEFLIKEMN